MSFLSSINVFSRAGLFSRFNILSRFRILTKILGVIGLLSLVAAAIAVVGLLALVNLKHAADQMEQASARALLLARLNQTVLALNRAEFRLLSDPSASTRNETKMAVSAERAAFRANVEKLSATLSDDEKAEIQAISDKFGEYTKILDASQKKAEEVSKLWAWEQVEELRKFAKENSSASLAGQLRGAIRALENKHAGIVQEASNAATAEFDRSSVLVVAIAGGGIVIGLFLGVIVGLVGIARPIRMIVGVLKELANGDYEVEVPGTTRRDEVGDVARAALVFKENGVETQRLREAQTEAAEQAEIEKRQMMIELADSFEQSVGGVVQSVTATAEQINAGAVTLAGVAEETTRQAQHVASSSEHTSLNVQTVSSATEEMSVSIAEIGVQVSSAQSVALSAVEQASRTTRIVSHLAETANRIGEIVDLIDSIAAKTNLLALNATIEAARAGDSGKGFAVVAQEVKALASQTAKATQEISTQISGVQAATDEAVEAIGSINGTIEQIKEITIAVASAVEEQTAATREIARSIEEAASGAAEVTQSIHTVSTAASETGGAAERMQLSSATLNDNAGTLSREVNAFIARVRAA